MASAGLALFSLAGKVVDGGFGFFFAAPGRGIANGITKLGTKTGGLGGLALRVVGKTTSKTFGYGQGAFKVKTLAVGAAVQYGVPWAFWVLTVMIGVCCFCAPFLKSILEFVLEWFAHVLDVINGAIKRVDRNIKEGSNVASNRCTLFFLYFIRFAVGFVRKVFEGVVLLGGGLSRHFVTFVFLIFFIFLFTQITDSLDHFVSFGTNSWDLIKDVYEVGAGGLNLVSDVIQPALPFYNVFISFVYRVGRTVGKAVSATFLNPFTPDVAAPDYVGGGRRLNQFYSSQEARIANFDLFLDATNQVTIIVATIADQVTDLIVFVLDFTLTYLMPILPSIFDTLKIMLVKLECMLVGGIPCALAEFGQVIIVALATVVQTIVNAIPLVHIDIIPASDFLACGGETLKSNGVPCKCAGTIFSDTGFYASVLPCTEPSVNCGQRDGLWVQQIDADGVPTMVTQAKTYAAGCSVGGRLLKAIDEQNLLVLARTFEDLGHHGCMEVCQETVQHVVCDNGFMNVTGLPCGTNRRRLRREADASARVVSQIRTRADLASLDPGPTALGGVTCDWTATTGNPFQTLFDGACATKYLYDLSPQTFESAAKSFAAGGSAGRRLQDEAMNPSAGFVGRLRRMQESFGRRGRLMRALQTANMTHDEKMAEYGKTDDDGESWHFVVAVHQSRKARASGERRRLAREERVAASSSSRRRLNADALLGKCGQLYTCPGGECVARSSSCPEPVWSQAGIWTYLRYGVWWLQNVAKSVSPGAIVGSITNCWDSYDAQPATYPFKLGNLNKDADDASVVYCSPMIGPSELHLHPIVYDAREAIYESCVDQGSIAACQCPLYVRSTIDFDQKWIGMISENVPNHLTNGLIEVQFLLTYFLTDNGVLAWVNWGWGSFWSIFPGVSPTWVNLFGNQGSNQTYGQRWTCFFLFGGDLAYLLFFCFLVYFLFLALWPPFIFVAATFFEPLKDVSDNAVAWINPAYAIQNRNDRDILINRLLSEQALLDTTRPVKDLAAVQGGKSSSLLPI